MAAQDSGAGGTDGRHRTPAQWFRAGSVTDRRRIADRGRSKGPVVEGDPAGPAGRRGGGVVEVLVAAGLLLAVNWVVSSVLLSPQSRARSCPTRSSSTRSGEERGDDHLDRRNDPGELKKPASYTPAGGKTPNRSPASRPNGPLSRTTTCSSSSRAPVCRSTPTRRTPVRRSGSNCFSASGRRCCWSGCSSRSPGAGGGGAGGALGSFGRSRATLYRPEPGPRTTFADVAGIDEVESEVTEIVDFLRDPEQVPAAGRADPARACCCPAHRAAVRRCWRGPSPARRRCRSSRSPPPSSSRRSSASARAGCGTCSSRPRRSPRRSSSSTSWTRSAVPEAAPSRSAATTNGSRPSTRSSPRWTASPATRASSCSRRPTGRRSSTRRCCARAGSTAGSRSARRT